MTGFADQTGILSSKNPPRRYLWTDAYAVCNFLSLYRQTGEDEFKYLALSLIDQVHNILGKHREDDPRSGWISRLSDAEGKDHPTAGGLRIGKTMGERGPEDAFDERLEWQRDGQYFHYLTKWMHALCRASAVTGELRYCRWAVDLAKVAHAGFTTVRPMSNQRHLYWKMSIDLSYPLVPTTGLHDPLDAYVTYNELRLCADKIPLDLKFPDLDEEIAESVAMIEGQHWHTDDPLGLGGLLFDAGRVFQMAGNARLRGSGIAETLIQATVESLADFAAHRPLNERAEYRLAFRELGLSIGLKVVEKLRSIVANNPAIFADRLQQDIEELRKYIPLGKEIDRFWFQRGNQQVRSWLDHSDINCVMLATSLLPDEFLAV